MNDRESLLKIRGFLTAINGRILQISNRKANAAMGAAASTVAGTAAASSITGLVGLFGTASTGTALAGLAGAAKSTATFYWIGSIVGGGVAAGTLIIGVGAVGAGVYGSKKNSAFPVWTTASGYSCRAGADDCPRCHRIDTGD